MFHIKSKILFSNLKVQTWSPAILVFSLLAFYQFFYVLNFFPITEGWFSVYAWLIRSGYVPYRDFPLLMPPIYPLLLALIQTFFGEGILALRIIGVFVVSGIGVCLWFILSRFFNPWICALSAIVGCIYYQMGNAFIPYDFTQFLTFFLLLGSSFMLFTVMNISLPSKGIFPSYPSFFSGLFLGIAVLIKQSNAGFFTFVMTIGYTLILFRVLSFRQAIKMAAIYVTGGLSVLVAILIWLGLHGAIYSFYNQVVFDALQSKGGNETIIVGWLYGFFGAPSYPLRSFQVTKNMLGIFFWTAAPLSGFALMALSPQLSGYLNKDLKNNLKVFLDCKKITFNSIMIIFMIIGFLASWIFCPLQNPTSQNAHEFTIAFISQFVKFLIWSFLPGVFFIYFSQKFLFIKDNKPTNKLKLLIYKANIFIAAIGILCIGCLIIVTYMTPQFISPDWKAQGSYFGANLIVFSTNLYVIASTILLALLLYKPSIQKAGLLILFLIGLGLVVGNGTSAGLSEISAFYGLSLYIAVLFTVGAPLLVPSILPLVISFQLCSFLIESKMSQPYAWWAVKTEDIRKLKCTDTTNVLKGVCLDDNKNNNILKIVRNIQALSDPTDELYVFPHLPIFNLLSGRRPYQNAVVSWFDFTSKAQAKNIALSLLRDPPKVLIMARLPLDVFEAHERLFNKSELSEQRNIVGAIDLLRSDGRILLIDSSIVDGITVELYQRVN